MYRDAIFKIRFETKAVVSSIRSHRAEFSRAKTAASEARSQLKTYKVKAMSFAVPEYGPERTRLEKMLRDEMSAMVNARSSKLDLRWIARYLHLALAYTRGKRYDTCEQKCKTQVDPTILERTLRNAGVSNEHACVSNIRLWLKGEFILARPEKQPEPVAAVA